MLTDLVLQASPQDYTDANNLYWMYHGICGIKPRSRRTYICDFPLLSAWIICVHLCNLWETQFCKLYLPRICTFFSKYRLFLFSHRLHGLTQIFRLNTSYFSQRIDTDFVVSYATTVEIENNLCYLWEKIKMFFSFLPSHPHQTGLTH